MSPARNRPIRLRRPAQRAGGRFRRSTEDTLSGVANLADLMLVFATGLLEALRSAREGESVDTARGSAEQDLEDQPGRYRTVGQVYRDTATGHLLVVEEP